MIIKSLKVTGTGAVQQLSTDTRKAKWIGFECPSTNASTVLIGGAEVSASPAVGFPLAPGFTQFLPAISDMFEFYQFKETFLYIANGDVVNVLFGLEGSNS